MDNDTLIALYVTQMRSQGLAETTIRNRVSLLRTFGATVNLHTATLNDLRIRIGREGIKQSSRRIDRVTFVSFYRFLHDERLRDDDPTSRLPIVRVPRGVPRPFTWEQVEAMLTSGAYRKTRAMILVGYYQGFRVSQIARVRGDDIDTLSMTISTIAKGSKDGVLPLHPVIAELARSMPATSWWFPARDGSDRPISGASVTDLITDAKRRAGITDPKLTPHSLRHAFGTDLVEAGVDIRVIQELMMHESLATTQIYTRVSARLQRTGIESLPVRSIPTRSGRWDDKTAA